MSSRSEPEKARPLPRLLILSGAVPETHLAGSLVLLRLLRDYPPRLLLAIGPKPRSESELLDCEYKYLAPAPSGRLNLTRFAQLKRSLESLGLAGRIPMRRIESAVGAFAPQVVLCVAERRDYVDAAERFCRSHALPLVLIVHDRLESFELVYPPFRRSQIRRNARSYRFASARLCVSPEMVEYLAVVYGARGTVLYPIRSDILQPRPAWVSATLVAPPALTIGYCGSLSYGYGRRIREAIPPLARAGARLRVYSRDLEDVPGGTHCGAIPGDEVWNRVKKECDAVWLPYGHDTHHRTLYTTHFPSKLTEYVALGMPMLITGPGDATGVKWGLAHPSAALTIADDTNETLEHAVCRLREDAGLRTSLAAGAVGGATEFHPDEIRRQFLEVLRSVAR
jgi:hypothetical protein